MQGCRGHRPRVSSSQMADAIHPKACHCSKDTPFMQYSQSVLKTVHSPLLTRTNSKEPCVTTSSTAERRCMYGRTMDCVDCSSYASYTVCRVDRCSEAVGGISPQMQAILLLAGAWATEQVEKH